MLINVFTFSMSCIDVPLSAPMYQFLERNSLSLAYQTACLGVTESDWETLGKAALEALDLDVARKSFARLKDLRYLELITDLMDRKKAGTEDDQALLADVLAFQVTSSGDFVIHLNSTRQFMYSF